MKLFQLFLELFLSLSKVHRLIVTILHQFQLILAYRKALNIWIATTSYPDLFYCKFAIDSLVQIADQQDANYELCPYIAQKSVLGRPRLLNHYVNSLW
jgi:hypothetical protein